MKNRMEKKVHSWRFLLGAALVIVNSCASPSMFQSARSLGVDEAGNPDVRFQSGASAVLGNVYLGVSIDMFMQVALVPEVLELDLNFAFNSGLSAEVGAGLKYSFLEKNNFAMALFLQTGTLFAFSGGLTYLEVKPALLMSWNLKPDFNITMAPRFFIFVPLNSASEDPPLVITKNFGYGAGVVLSFDFGDALPIVPEVGVSYLDGIMAHAGVAFHFW